MRQKFLLFSIVISMGFFSALPVSAATITVTNMNDSGAGSLRQAIADAASGDTIVSSVTGTITLSSTLMIDKDLTISGPGASDLAITSSGVVFLIGSVAPDVTVTISGLAINRGYNPYGRGGGILNHGTLTVDNSSFSSNGATYGGGAIENGGTLTLTSCTFSNNWSGTSGGSIENGGTLTMTNSTISGGFANSGGGIENGGTLTMTNSTISGSTANSGGGIENGGTLTMTNSTISGSAANFGGGIENGGTLTMTNSIISDSTAYSGGGIDNGGTLTMTNSTFSGNSTHGNGGNGGGIENRGTLTMTNSTFSGNSTQNGNGGGIENRNTLTMTNSTFSGNSAPYGGGIANYGTLTMKSTVLANSTLGGNCFNFVMFGFGPFNSQGFNLSDDTSCSSVFTGTGDLNSTPAGLDPSGLQSNGGPTQTIALLPTSIAVDAIPVSDCTDVYGNPVATDQRGVLRPQDGDGNGTAACDIGAYEAVLSNTAPVADAGPDQAVTVIGSKIQLDGSKSYDPDGDPIKYQWSFSSIPAGSAATLSSATSSMPSFIADVHGTYIVQLIVSDPWMQSSPATVTISFSNVKPVANAGLSQSAFVGTTVTLNGSGSFDANGDPLTYQWSLASVPQGSQSVIASPTAMIATFVPNLPGLYVAQLVVNDGFINSDPSTVQVEVISNQNEAIDNIRNIEVIIGSLDDVLFKNPNMKNALINKLNAVIASISDGNYGGALDQLQNDIMAKLDGCAMGGAPDKNDWIINCQGQSQVYASIMNLIQLVQGMK